MAFALFIIPGLFAAFMARWLNSDARKQELHNSGFGVTRLIAKAPLRVARTYFAAIAVFFFTIAILGVALG